MKIKCRLVVGLLHLCTCGTFDFCENRMDGVVTSGLFIYTPKSILVMRQFLWSSIMLGRSHPYVYVVLATCVTHDTQGQFKEEKIMLCILPAPRYAILKSYTNLLPSKLP